MSDNKPAVDKPVTSTVDHQSAADKSAEKKQAVDDKKVVDARAAEREHGPKAAPKKAAAHHHGKLGKAGESGDPAVQHALAELQTAQMNRRSLDVEEADVKAADAAVKVAQDALAELGYE
jgi:hypothetical protein